LGDRRVHGRGSTVLGRLLEELESSLHLENSLEWGNSLRLDCNTVGRETGEADCNGGGQGCRRECNGA